MLSSLDDYLSFLKVSIKDFRVSRKGLIHFDSQFDSHIIDWDKFLPRFNQFKVQEQESRVMHGFA